MATWFQAAFRWLVAVSIAATLVACGGGGGGGESIPPATPSTVFTTTAAAKSPYTFDGRLLAATSVTGVPTIDYDALFAWAERWDQNSNRTFFPAGPTTQTGTFDGEQFAYRLYSTGASIRVRVRDGVVFVQWADGRIYEVGTLAHYACVVTDCGGGSGTPAPTTAGDLAFSSDGGTSLTIVPSYKGNLITGLGAKVDGVDKGFEIPADQVDEVCWRSDRLLNWGKRGVVGCNQPAGNGELRITRIANNDCGRVTLWTKTGQELWIDFDSPNGWKIKGLNAKVNPACGIEYGPNGFQRARIYAVREADGTASLVWDFGSDLLGGFFGKDGQPIGFDTTDAAKTYMFALNGNKQGPGYGSGWGLGDGRKTPAGDPIQSTIRQAWLEFKDGRYLIKFTNLACTDKVNATAYVGSGPAASVVYDYGTDGFGLGWAGLPYQANPSVWTAGEGVIFDSVNGQLEYGVPFCTQK